MRRLTRKIAKIAIVMAVIKGVGFVIAKAFEGDVTASDNDFKFLTVMDGREHNSHATSLRTGSATTVLGGADIDLRNATLDPGGAHLALKAILGGIRLTVPDGWRVDVAVDAQAGEVEVKTPEPSTAGDGAPRLFVEAYARMAGIEIRTA